MKSLKALLLFCGPLGWAADPTVVSLFPSDTLTVPDPKQATGLRVNLPNICDPAACIYQVLNQLDGFSVNPRIAVQYSGPVNTDTLRSRIFITPADAPFNLIPINQVIYDPSTFTVYAKPDRVLDQQTQYRLFVTDQSHIIASTTFTTLSVSTWLARVRMNLASSPPSIATAGSYRFSDVATLTLHEQTHANPSRFQDVTLPVSLLPGIGSISFGTFRSPTYLNAQQAIDILPTALDPGPGLGANQLSYHAVVPSSAKPARGYPVIIYGHGLGDSQYGGPSAAALTMAPAGFAIISINAVGHGYGPDSTVILRLKNGQQVQIPAGGRSIPDTDGTIQPYGGCILLNNQLGIRDCLRQTAIDIMQLVRMLKTGVDLDGDGTVDLDPNRIYYIGQSLGSLYGTLLTAVETNLPVVTLNAGGGSLIDIAQWSPDFRKFVVQGVGLPANFNEDYVLRDQPVKVVDVPGAITIQNLLERLDWADMIGGPLAYAKLLRPVAGLPAKKVLFQFAIGDQTVPNPTESALVRTADMRQSTWVFRNDLARAVDPALPANPHAYLTNILNGGGALSIALAAQGQIAGFFASDGVTIPNPNTKNLNFFEVPAVLPNALGF